VRRRQGRNLVLGGLVIAYLVWLLGRRDQGFSVPIDALIAVGMGLNVLG
jgi:hypothetical protein